MKVLVVSLLRLGDIVLATPTLKALREAHPDSQIDLMVNEQFRFVGDILSGVNRIVGFPRLDLQEEIGDPAAPLFQPYDELKDLVREIKQEEYDLVINLTHNRLSGYLCSLIEAPETHGLHFSPRGEAIFGSDWYHHLNKSHNDSTLRTFHFSDVYKLGSGLSTEPKTTLVRKYKSIKRVEELLKGWGDIDLVAVQLKTSDSKKDIPTDLMMESLKLFHTIHPRSRFVVLGAPGEEKEIQDFSDQVLSMGVPSIAFACNLSEALSLLDQAGVLLTGDTSIKHLATATSCRIVEVCLGSSRPLETGAYQDNAIVVRPKTSCYPCLHSESCSQSEFICRKGIEPTLLAALMSRALMSQFSDLRQVAAEFTDVEISRARTLETGFWYLQNVSDSYSENTVVHQLVAKAALMLRLSKSFHDHIGPFGSCGRKLAEDLRNLFGSFLSDETVLQMLFRSVKERSQRLDHLSFEFSRMVRSGCQPFREGFGEEWDEWVEQTPYLDDSERAGLIAETADCNPMPFVQVRKIQRAIHDSLELNEIESKLYKVINSIQMELK